MRASKLSAVAAAVVACAVAAFMTVPAEAQTPTGAGVRPVRVVPVVRPPARVTVRKRSYLDPGTETKRRAEHDTDYAYPTVEYGFAPFRNSTLFKNNGALPFIHDRMPFPTCLDLPGFCQ